MRIDLNLNKREHWSKWEDKRLIRIGYWPQYRDWQKDWVHFDAKQIVSDLVKGKIDVLDWGVPENWTYIDTTLTRKHPALRELKYDPLKRLVSECKKHNIKFLIGLAMDEILECNIEFCIKNKDLLRKQGMVFEKDGRPPVYQPFCFNIPLIRRVIPEYLIGFAKEYDIDGYIFDTSACHNPLGEDGKIKCRFCKEKYEKEKGKAFPKVIKEDWNDPVWKQYLIWINKERREWMEYIHSEIKKYDDRLYVVVKHIGGKFDSTHQETNLHGIGLLAPASGIKEKMASIDGRRAGGIMKTSELANGGFSYGRPSYVDAITQTYITLANGGWVEFHSTMDDKGVPHKKRTEVYIRVGKEIAKKKEYFIDAQPIPSVAILDSEHTTIWYEGRNPASFRTSFTGCEQALIESHIPTGYITDSQLKKEYLKRYKMLFLPNTACMSDEGISAVKEFVRDGGGLVPTHETSLYNEYEERRKDFGLGELFGVRLKGVSKFAEDYSKGELIRKHPYILHKSGMIRGMDDMEIANIPWFDIKADKTYKITGTWAEVKKGTIQGCVNMGCEITGDSGNPCIVAGKYGKGKVVYVSFDITSDYCFRNVGQTRELIKRMVNWTAKVPIYAEAPKSIELTILEQKGKGRIIANLVNYAAFNKSAGIFIEEPVDMGRYSERNDFEDKQTEKMALRLRRKECIPAKSICDEVIPIHNIPLYVNKKIKRAYLAPEKKTLKVIREKGRYKITIPKIDVHAMVVLEI